MNKIWVILKREYLTRVKNKTFIIMTFLGPVLIALFYGGIFLVAMKDASDNTKRQVIYKDHSGFFEGKLDTFDNYNFIAAPSDKFESLKKVSKGEFYAYLEIRDRELQSIDSVEWVSRQTLSLVQKNNLSDLLSEKVYEERLVKMGLRQGTIDSLRPSATMNLVEIGEDGSMKSSSSGIKSGIGFALAFVVYLFIFLYGSMVMRSAIEEKTSRIVEVVVSSVKPFQMMLGKILGVALVGLTQFMAWVVLSVIFVITITSIFGSEIVSQAQQSAQTMPGGMGPKSIPVEGNMFDTLVNLPYFEIVFVFIVFFMGGFLLYSSMFAAIGAAVNQETDVQQFMFPISLPLVFGFVIAQKAVFEDPHGPLATIFSIIPFTSPVVMVVRAPFGVPWTQLLLATVLLIVTFILLVWITGRIYRVGILMYGKKPTWKELGKWIFRKE